MTGVSIDQWRGNIGVFHRKKVPTKSFRVCNNVNFYPIGFLSNIFQSLRKPFELLFNLVLLFAYCSMVVILFPILFIAQASIIFTLIPDILICPSVSYFNFLQPFQVFLGIQILPLAISLIITRSFSFFKKLSKNTKNILFFIFVLQILLFISGTVEINPGPIQRKKMNLSFAVWNVDSRPARDYARVPLIESLQATYGFDMFGVCESSLK